MTGSNTDDQKEGSVNDMSQIRPGVSLAGEMCHTITRIQNPVAYRATISGQAPRRPQVADASELSGNDEWGVLIYLTLPEAGTRMPQTEFCMHLTGGTSCGHGKLVISALRTVPRS